MIPFTITLRGRHYTCYVSFNREFIDRVYVDGVDHRTLTADEFHSIVHQVEQQRAEQESAALRQRDHTLFGTSRTMH